MTAIASPELGTPQYSVCPAENRLEAANAVGGDTPMITRQVTSVFSRTIFVPG
jgi:hypothetical protein